MSSATCPACGESFDPEQAEDGLLFRAIICPHCQKAFPVWPP